MTVEEFAKNLIKAISEKPLGGTQYVLASNLAAAIQRAVSPPVGGGTEFPKVLYRGSGDNQESKTVADSEEERNALAAGWNREPAKQPPSKYPEHWVEITAPRNPSARRVVIHNQSEETIFRRVTDDAFEWMRDDRFMFGGTPVGLDTLVQEHAAALHKQLDEELQQPPEVEPDIAPAGEGKEQ